MLQVLIVTLALFFSLAPPAASETIPGANPGVAGTLGVPAGTFAALGSGACPANPGQTCRLTDSESCSALDPFEPGDLPAYCRYDIPDGGSPAWIDWPGGSGDVVGPAGATTGNVPLFADPTGKLLSNSTVSGAALAIAAAHAAAPGHTTDTSAATTCAGTDVLEGSGACVPNAGGGTGDVVGPAGANDGAGACFDGATGKLLQECADDAYDAIVNVTGLADPCQAMQDEINVWSTAALGSNTHRNLRFVGFPLMDKDDGGDTADFGMCLAVFRAPSLVGGYPDETNGNASYDVVDWDGHLHIDFQLQGASWDATGQVKDYVFLYGGNGYYAGFGSGGEGLGVHKNNISTSGFTRMGRTVAQSDAAGRGSHRLPDFPFTEGNRTQFVAELYAGVSNGQIDHKLSCDGVAGASDRDDICRAQLHSNHGTRFRGVSSIRMQVCEYITANGQVSIYDSNCSGNSWGIAIGMDPNDGGGKVAAISCTGASCGPHYQLSHQIELIRPFSEGNGSCDYCMGGTDRLTFVAPHGEHGVGTPGTPGGPGFAWQVGHLTAADGGGPCTHDIQAVVGGTCTPISNGVDSGTIHVLGGRLGPLPTQWDANGLWYGVAAGPSGTAETPDSIVQFIGTQVNPSMVPGPGWVKGAGSADCNPATATGADCVAFVPNQIGADQPRVDLTKADWDRNLTYVRLPEYANNVMPDGRVGHIDLEYFGAVPDGVHDNLPTINKAMASLPAVGGELIFPCAASSYVIAPTGFDGIRVNGKDGVTIRGERRQCSILDLSGANSPPGAAAIRGCHGAACVDQGDGILIEELTIRSLEPARTCNGGYDGFCEAAGACGNCVSGEQDHPIEIKNYTDATVRRTLIINGGDECIGFSDVDGGQIVDNIVDGCPGIPGSAGSGLNTNGSSNILIARNEVKNILDNPSVCIDLFDTGGPPQASGSPDGLCDFDASTNESCTCTDLFDTGGPPQTSGSPDTFCDFDGTTAVAGLCQNIGAGIAIEDHLGAGSNQQILDNNLHDNEMAFGISHVQGTNGHTDTLYKGNRVSPDNGSCILSITSADHCAFAFSGVVNSTRTMIISNLFRGAVALGYMVETLFSGNTVVGTSDGDGLMLTNIGLSVTNNEVRGFGDRGLFLGSGVSKTTVSGNRFLLNAWSTGVSVIDETSGGTAEVDFANNVVSADMTGSNFGHTIRFRGKPTIRGNRIFGSTLDSINIPAGADECSITDNEFPTAGDSAIEVAADYCRIAGNRIGDTSVPIVQTGSTSDPGINVTGDENTIEGNELYNARGGAAGDWITATGTGNACRGNKTLDTVDGSVGTINCPIEIANVVNGVVDPEEVLLAQLSLPPSASIGRLWEVDRAATMTRFACYTDAGTDTVQLVTRPLPNGTSTNKLSGTLTADVDNQVAPAFASTGLAAGVFVGVEDTVGTATNDVTCALYGTVP